MIKDDVELAEIIWDFHHLNHDVVHSDCILMLGSHDTRVAKRGAELFLDGFAPLLICSGGLGNFTKGLWDETEAEKFAKIAIDIGVPEENILIENTSTNSGENIIFTRKLLKNEGKDPESFILVQKPYMERRAFATFKKVWPGKQVIVTSPQISLKNYPTSEISMNEVINIIVGDLHRLMVYPKLNFQIEQEIPNIVYKAFIELIKRGFDGHLLQDHPTLGLQE
ncbi:MAG: YdcF family protein [Promethearchaeota archaeon]